MDVKGNLHVKGNIITVTPANLEVATKVYVDAAVAGVSGGGGGGFYGVYFRESDGNPPTFRNDTLIFNSSDFYLSSDSVGKPTINLRGSTGSGGGLNAVVDDPAPQLGGDLDTQGFTILTTDGTGNRDSVAITAGTSTDDNRAGSVSITAGASAVNPGSINLTAPGGVNITATGPSDVAVASDQDVFIFGTQNILVQANRNIELSGSSNTIITLGSDLLESAIELDQNKGQIRLHAVSKFYIDSPNVVFSGSPLHHIGTPTAPSDAATKAYVDASPGTGLQNISEDSTPELGGDLNTTGFYIYSSGDVHVVALNANQAIRLDGFNVLLNATGQIDLTSAGTLTVNAPSVSMNSSGITDVTDPVSPQDVATKAYVDAQTAGGGGGGFYGIYFRESDGNPPTYRNDTIIFSSAAFYLNSNSIGKPILSFRGSLTPVESIFTKDAVFSKSIRANAFYLSSGVDLTVDTLQASVEAAAIMNVEMDTYAPYSYIVEKIEIGCRSGSATAGFYIVPSANTLFAGTIIPGADPIAITTTKKNIFPTSGRTVNTGDTLVFSIYANGGAAKRVRVSLTTRKVF